MGRPPSKPKRFKDGFYIEVRNKGADSGMKIWSENREEMLRMADMYRQNKDVVVLGEHKKDRWIEIEPAPKQRGRKAKVPVVTVADEPDAIDELIGDIDLEEIESAGEDKKEGKAPKKVKENAAPKAPKAKAVPKKKEKAAAKPKAKAVKAKPAKAKVKPKAAAKAKPKAKVKAKSKPNPTKKKKR